MLILSRRVDESIRISDHIKLTVLSVNGKQVRIGINAPDDVGIFREEIYLDIQANQNNNSIEPASYRNETAVT